ncbi:hypothetical protein WG66_014538 [Moniliophthora roreri]|nr:hypothetical protein WG66_014538 [Moniliophthora roreri]
MDIITRLRVKISPICTRSRQVILHTNGSSILPKRSFLN